MKTCDLQARHENAPSVPDDETILFREPGRILDNKAEGGHTNVCYRSFAYAVTVGKFGHPYTLRTHSGLGEFSHRLTKEAARILEGMDSDSRFFMCHALKSMFDEGAKVEGARVDMKYRQAFVDGRLKKRKVRGQDAAKVWIETARAQA